MKISLIDFFLDPILAAPTWATMFMCLASSMIGVFMVVKRRALLGEAISHTTYLGIALGIYFGADWLAVSPSIFPFLVIICAFISALVGMKMILYLEKSQKVSPDSALCFVLSTFLGLGILLASRLQFSHPIWTQKIQMFLYGQAATITMQGLWIYVVLTCAIILVVVLFFQAIRVTLFDPEYAKIVKLNTDWIELLINTLLISAIVIGIRSVGVLMITGMLIAPAAAAAVITRKFSKILLVAAALGLLSGLIGNISSVYLSEWLRESLTGFRVSFPTGPMILISAVTIAFVIFLFEKRRGYVWRKLRKKRFNAICNGENILKLLYKTSRPFTFSELKTRLGISRSDLIKALLSLRWTKSIEFEGGIIELTKTGKRDAERIIRLHRLWEVYLFNVLGIHAAKVHTSAEEMEHILTPEIEKKLIEKLGDPERDPHDQIIPKGIGEGA